MAFLGRGEKRGVELVSWLADVRRAATDVLYPPLCFSCGTEVDSHRALCGPCWSGLTFIAGSVCACCGLPFDTDLGDDTLCGQCLESMPSYDRARAVLVYNEGARKLVLPFKHADRLESAPSFALWLKRALGPMVQDPAWNPASGPASDLASDPAGGTVVPQDYWVAAVPLHRRRLWRRRYNQSALLANGLAKALGYRAVPDLLRRTRATPSQGGLSRTERQRNVRGAFDIRDLYRRDLHGKVVMLVDDVMTTGATVEACARSLKEAGAAKVYVIVLARAMRADAV